ncbi:MAG: hypothetical protein J0L55_13370, partial [Caulobacterales bacterium]|nr:hypothetical protein [Caulobacterales bacterium]
KGGNFTFSSNSGDSRLFIRTPIIYIVFANEIDCARFKPHNLELLTATKTYGLANRKIAFFAIFI